MNSNRIKAQEWWMTLSEELKDNLFKEYYPGSDKLNITISPAKIESIYTLENLKEKQQLSV